MTETGGPFSRCHGGPFSTCHFHFRDWAAERSGHTRDVIETALAHTVGDDVERSYARSDLFDQRRALMAQWAAYVTAGADLCW